MPLRVSYALADLVGEIWYLASPRLRKVLAYNLSLLAEAGEAETRDRGRLARRISRNFGRVVVEFLYSPRLSSDNLRDLVDVESFEPLKKYAAAPGAVFATAHLGSWELAGAVLSMMGIDLTVIVYDDPDPRVARLFRERREAKGIRVVPVRATARELLSAIQDTSLGVVADRDFSGQGMITEFFGVRSRVPFAYAGLAVSRGMPVVFGVCVKLEDGKYHLMVEEPVRGDRDDREAGKKIARRCVHSIEKYVEEHPEQWYFFEKIGGELD